MRLASVVASWGLGMLALGEPRHGGKIRRAGLERFKLPGVGGSKGGLKCWRRSGGGLSKGVKILRLRTAIHTVKLTSQNCVGESHT